MLTKEANERLTKVGPGTPVGELMRRYWQPIASYSEVLKNGRKRVRILGEDLVIFLMGDNKVALLKENCTHRGASLYYGFNEKDGIRCAYHGWKYNLTGKCMEQPFEPEGSNFKNKVRQPAYRAIQYRGLIWAYMGPEPAPVFPLWDVIARDDGVRLIFEQDSDYNWLQGMENSMDVTHVYFLHGITLRENMPEEWKKSYQYVIDYYTRKLEKFDFKRFEFGFRRIRKWGGKEESQEKGYPLIFPNISIIPFMGLEMGWRVPIDDEHTKSIHIEFYPSLDGSKVDQLDSEIPTRVNRPYIKNSEGEYFMYNFPSTDAMAFETPGAVFDRTQEHLGSSDRGIILYRQMLAEQISAVERGEDPIAVIRDTTKANEIISLVDKEDYEKKRSWGVSSGLYDKWFEELRNGEVPMIDAKTEHFGHQV